MFRENRTVAMRFLSLAKTLFAQLSISLRVGVIAVITCIGIVSISAVTLYSSDRQITSLPK